MHLRGPGVYSGTPPPPSLPLPPRSLSPLALSSVLVGRKAVWYMWLMIEVND